MRYPPDQPVVAIPIATAARGGPNMFATTVGNDVKKAPLATPLSIAKTIRGGKVLDTGQIANILIALRT